MYADNKYIVIINHCLTRFVINDKARTDIVDTFFGAIADGQLSQVAQQHWNNIDNGWKQCCFNIGLMLGNVGPILDRY